MYASLNWLASLLGQELDPTDAAQRLTLIGAAVDAVEPVHQELRDVVIGVVEAFEKHPDADRLTLCRVNAGAGIVEVVCGAPNVKQGAKYPYAAAGTSLPGGFKLERRKIRGVVSNGMLCSARELGLGTDEDGILELNTDAEPGTPLLSALSLADTRLELDITPNRPDLLGHRGIARELAASLGLNLRLPTVPGAPVALAPRRVESHGVIDGFEVTLEDVEGCPRYGAALIRGVTIGPSPDWLQARLQSIGARPINNVVDATNYILHELNQPLHAFDLARLRGGQLVIRRARAGERMTTLDGQPRLLSPEMTMICDAEGPVAVAGVMGGENSEVSETTQDLLLECAYFDPRRIRTTRTALKMDTDASYRFERGIDLQGVTGALRRAIELIIAVAGGKEEEASLDLWPRQTQPPTVFLRQARVEHVLGVPVAREEIETLLTGVGFAVAPRQERLAVQVPGWRPDVTQEVDLIEEIARLKGYDAFPVELRPFRPSTVPDAPAEIVGAAIRRLLTGLGMHEARTLPLGDAGSEDAQPIQNPLSSDEAYLRSEVFPGLRRSVELNWSLRTRDVRLFEIGRVFRAEGEGPPHERLRVAAAMTGARMPPHWSASGQSPDLDLWDLKGMLEEIIPVVVPGSTIEPAGEQGWTVISREGQACGWAGPIEADSPPWAAELFGFEVDVAAEQISEMRFVRLPGTPAAERDLALVIPPALGRREVEGLMHQAGGDLLESARVFDEYRSPELGGRSVAWRLVFRDPERTLRDAEVDKAMKRIVKLLKDKLGVERR